ncbi:MAG TPA: IS110 family transposase [Oscillatoriaceae cyanobacterium M33_DOE_052]|nr:IS110 family transposase [Oscillatoriaceae cyanobacterium M33_DOE_052]
MEGLYAGSDLHGNSNFLGIIDAQGKRVFKKKLPNEIVLIRQALQPFQGELVGVAVESTYNWYWLVDGLMEEGYKVHLANPSAIQQYTGLKHADDKHDAFWLAEMLRLGILPEGYIYPKEERPVRDLLRKRGHLVRLRTSLVVSLQNILSRNLGRKLRVSDIKSLREDRITSFLGMSEDIALAGRVSKEVIDQLTRQVYRIEWVVQKRIALKEAYRYLLTLPGVGKILALTIMLETGPISRFETVGDYVSYCRKVPSQWMSNGKWKGSGNRKNGNKYLSWAYAEASEFARRLYPEPRAYYDRKMQKTNAAVAHSALSNKLARAGYYVIRDQVPFRPEKLFG